MPGRLGAGTSETGGMRGEEVADVVAGMESWKEEADDRRRLEKASRVSQGRRVSGSCSSKLTASSTVGRSFVSALSFSAESPALQLSVPERKEGRGKPKANLCYRSCVAFPGRGSPTVKATARRDGSCPSSSPSRSPSALERTMSPP